MRMHGGGAERQMHNEEMHECMRSNESACIWKVLAAGLIQQDQKRWRYSSRSHSPVSYLKAFWNKNKDNVSNKNHHIDFAMQVAEIKHK